MIFNITPNHRSYQVRFILDLVFSLFQSRLWPVTTVLVTHKGKSGSSNMAETVKGIFEDGKIVDLAGKKVSTGEIIAKAETFDATNKGKKAAVLLEGRHRVVALWLLETFLGVTLEPEVTEVGDDMAGRIALESNLTNETIAKMLSTEKLSGIVDAVRANVYKKQTDLPVKRGQQQSLWHRAQAVIVQGISVDDASKLTYKEADQIVKGAVTLEAVLAERAGNAKKVLPGEKLRDLVVIAKNYDKDAANLLTKLLVAITDNAETTAKTLIVEHFTKR